VGDGEPREDCRLGHWAIDFRKKNQKITQKKSDYRVPVWVKSPIRTGTDNPIKLSIRVPENSVRVSGFRFGFSVSDLFEHP